MAYYLQGMPSMNYRDFPALCFWNAVHNPMPFVYQRNDNQIVSAADESGLVKITTNQEFTLTDVFVGSFVEIFQGGDYNGIFEVVSSTPPNEFVIDVAFVGDSSGLINFLSRKNWYLQCEIQLFKTATSTFETIATLLIQHDALYSAKCDVFSILKNTVVYSDKNAYTEDLTWADKLESGRYKVKSTEFFNGLNQGRELTSDEFFFTNSAMQLQNAYGSNLAKYVLKGFDTGLGTGYVKKMMGNFETPTYFQGYPFSISLISAYVLGENEVFVFKTPNGEEEIEIDIKYMNRLSVNLIDSDILTNNSPKMEYKISVFDSVLLTYQDLCEPQFLEINNECRKSPVYLNWLSTDGSRNYWLFEDIQELLKDVKSGNSYEISLSNNFELENAQTKLIEISRAAQPKLTVQATLHVDKVKGLHNITHSVNVLMHMGFDGVNEVHIWQQVFIEDGSFKICDTTDSTATIELTLILDSINIQAQ